MTNRTARPSNVASHAGSTFARVERRSWTLVDAAAQQMREAIARGELRVGDQLPPERTLVKQLGVSRVVLREALSSLEALGIIERRSTRGRFVAAGGSTERSSALVAAWLYQHASDIHELDELRSLVETHTMRTFPEDQVEAAVRLGRRLLLDQSVAASRSDTVATVDIDLDFHWLFVSHSSNNALRGLGRELIDQSREAGLALYSLPGVAAQAIVEHQALFDAFAKGDRERAADLLGEHHSRAALARLQQFQPGLLSAD